MFPDFSSRTIFLTIDRHSKEPIQANMSDQHLQLQDLSAGRTAQPAPHPTWTDDHNRNNICISSNNDRSQDPYTSPAPGEMRADNLGSVRERPPLFDQNPSEGTDTNTRPGRVTGNTQREGDLTSCAEDCNPYCVASQEYLNQGCAACEDAFKVCCAACKGRCVVM